MGLTSLPPIWIMQEVVKILENIVLLTILGAERDTQPVLGVRFSAQCLMVNV